MPGGYLRDVKTISTLYFALLTDIRLDLRRGYTLGGLMLLVLGIVYITYLAIPRIEPQIWIAVYWIAFLFLGIHTTLNSFARESSRRYLYYYTIIAPELLFLAKCLYNALTMFVLGMLMFGAMSFIHGNPIRSVGMFMIVLLLGSMCITVAFTLISGIAVKSDQSATLMTIAAFPVVIPALLIVVRLSLYSLLDSGAVDPMGSIAILFALVLLVIGLGLLLFPYLWRS